jgi:hypothetical protein
VAWWSYQDTVGTWITRSLFATGSSSTSAVVLMTPFQTLSLVALAESSYRDRLYTYTVRLWVGR